MTMGGFVSFGFSFGSVESVFLGSVFNGLVSGCLGVGGSAWSGLVTFGAGFAGCVGVALAGCLGAGSLPVDSLPAGALAVGSLPVGALASLGEAG